MGPIRRGRSTGRFWTGWRWSGGEKKTLITPALFSQPPPRPPGEEGGVGLQARRAGGRNRRDAGGGGGPERHRRIGDAPPSPWPAKGLVSGLGRLYGPFSRWPKDGDYGGLGKRSLPTLPEPLSLAVSPRFRRDDPDPIRDRFGGHGDDGASPMRRCRSDHPLAPPAS